MPEQERVTIDFVCNVCEETLKGLYFIHDHHEELMLMENGALVHYGKYLDE